MYRYVVFSWDAKEPKKTAAAQHLTRLLLSASSDWQRVIDRPGLRIFDAPHPGGARHAYVLPSDAGVVLGRLFKNDIESTDAPPEPVLDDAESRRLIESKGRHLVENYWGHYVAILQPPASAHCHVLRDPTGGLPCYMTQSAGVGIVLSDIEDCVHLSLVPFSIDWDHVTAFFQHVRLVTHTTGFKEVTMLYAGECVALAGDTVKERSFYWDPVDVCTRNTIEDPDQARSALGATVKHCINAWASNYDSIVHELSGGLDSSIIAACLASNSVLSRLLCFHYYTEMSEGDERSYARAVAHKVRSELVERRIPVSEKPLKELLSSTRYATPAMQEFDSPVDRAMQGLVKERRAGAVFTGRGGDNLFQERRTLFIAAEFAHRHGVRPRLFEIVQDTSKLTYRSAWAVLGCVINRGLLKRRYDAYKDYAEARPMLSDDARAALNPASYRHPWVTDAPVLPVSKLLHILSVVDCQTFNQMPCSYAEQIHPLISQPIIECCLQIPTYVLTHGGVPRKLIREAFETDVPKAVLRRQVKGFTTSYYSRLFSENAAFLREFLLDGLLVREGVLDRSALERLLSDRELIVGREIASIMCSVAAEKWLSNWGDVRQRTAA